MIYEVMRESLFFPDSYIFTCCFDLIIHTVETGLFTMPRICKGLTEMIGAMFTKLLKKTPNPSKSQLNSTS